MDAVSVGCFFWRIPSIKCSIAKAASSLLCSILNIMATGMHNHMIPSRAAAILPGLPRPKLSCYAAGGSKRLDESAVGKH